MDAPRRRGPGPDLSPFGRLAAAVAAAAAALGARRAPPDVGLVEIRDGRVAAADRAVRRVLGPAARVGAPAGAVAAAVASDRATAEAIEALVARGESFRRRASLGDAVYDVAGEPWGLACRISFRDVTADAAAIAAAERARDLADAQAAALRLALDRRPEPVWLEGPDGAVVWGNRAAGGLAPPAGVRRIEPPGGGAAVLVGAPDREARSADRALRLFIETVTETFAHLSIGLAIFDEGRRLTLANPAVAQVFAIDPRALAGQPTLRETLDQLRMARRLPEHADFAAWRARLFTLFDDPSRGSLNEIWHLPDGRSISVVARPHPLGGVAFIFEDLTPSLDLEREKTTLEALFRQTIDMLAMGVAVIGADGRPRIANPAFRLMWGLDDPGAGPPGHVADLARACRALRPEPDVWERIRAAVASGGARENWTCRVALADGRVLEARVSPMPDQSTLTAFLDVTDGARVAEALRERAEALEAAEEMRTALADQLSHRLRTPLTAVIGFAQMLAEGRAGALDARQASYVDSIASAGQLLLESIEHLADLAAVEADDVGPGAGPAPVAPALSAALAMVERRAADRGARIELGPVAADAQVRGDAVSLRRLIGALLLDVLSHAPEGGRVRAGVEARGGLVEIWCEADVGRGDDLRPNALARRVAALSGGVLTAETGADGRARVVCRLPAATGAAAA